MLKNKKPTPKNGIGFEKFFTIINRVNLAKAPKSFARKAQYMGLSGSLIFFLQRRLLLPCADSSKRCGQWGCPVYP